MNPSIKLVLILTKRDTGEINHNAVSQHLGIMPSKISAPILSKAKLNCDAEICEVEKELSGITILPSASPPYQILKHAFWCVELPKIECWRAEESILQMEQMFKGKESKILQVCEEYNLSVDLIVQVFAERNNMPELKLSHKSISFWATIGTSISFDFYLD